MLAAIEDLDFAARLQGRQAGEGDALHLWRKSFPPLVEEWAGQALAKGIQLRMAPQAEPAAIEASIAIWPSGC